jgi:hypothetical protein
MGKLNIHVTGRQESGQGDQMIFFAGDISGGFLLSDT